MGVWIEIQFYYLRRYREDVTPLVGVWIEIMLHFGNRTITDVTPLVGVWIEIFASYGSTYSPTSHSPCGSVD